MRPKTTARGVKIRRGGKQSESGLGAALGKEKKTCANKENGSKKTHSEAVVFWESGAPTAGEKRGTLEGERKCG